MNKRTIHLDEIPLECVLGVSEESDRLNIEFLSFGDFPAGSAQFKVWRRQDSKPPHGLVGRFRQRPCESIVVEASPDESLRMDLVGDPQFWGSGGAASSLQLMIEVRALCARPVFYTPAPLSFAFWEIASAKFAATTYAFVRNNARAGQPLSGSRVKATGRKIFLDYLDEFRFKHIADIQRVALRSPSSPFEVARSVSPFFKSYPLSPP